MKTQVNETIVITGATGYVGSHLTAALRQADAQVRCLVRPESRQLDVDFLQACRAKVFKTHLNDRQVMAEALAGASVVVHLIGSIAPRRGQKFSDLHAGQVQQLIERCRENDVKKVVMVTALGTKSGALSQYHSSKWQAEQCLRESGLDYVILRPSLLVGRQAGQRDSKLIARLTDLIKNKKMVPLVGGGANKIQPLFIGDLIEALSSVISSHDYDGQTLELAGPQVMTMKELAVELMNSLNIHKPVVNLPGQAAQLIAACLELLQPVPVLSRDQVTLSLNDNTSSLEVLGKILQRRPQSLKTALQSYKQSVSNTSIKAVV